MSGDIYYDESSCDPDAFCRRIETRTDAGDVPRATEIVANIPVYDTAAIEPELAGAARASILAEWARVFDDGPGVLMLRGLIADRDVVDRCNRVFRQILAEEAEASLGKGDHFAAAGRNARIWNSAQKLCLAAPDAFARYFGNVALAAVCEAWLGPGYQMTAQVNLVYPGGEAQQGHRDYHLGFQSPAAMTRFPAHVHALSPALTLQGAIAHCDMPVASGPTRLLPYSQSYGPGYLATARDDFRELFETHCVQLPLVTGDALFFNPALFHAAGQNRSADIERLANLLQISSPFGRAMESLDRAAMCRTLYPTLAALRDELGAARVAAAIAACAEAYPFPTNLDRDPPIDGLAPPSQADLLHRALAEEWPQADIAAALDAWQRRRDP